MNFTNSPTLDSTITLDSNLSILVTLDLFKELRINLYKNLKKMEKENISSEELRLYFRSKKDFYNYLSVDRK